MLGETALQHRYVREGKVKKRNSPFALIASRASGSESVVYGGPLCTIDRTFTLAFSLAELTG